MAVQLSDTEKQTLLVKLVLKEPKYLSVIFFLSLQYKSFRNLNTVDEVWERAYQAEDIQ